MPIFEFVCRQCGQQFEELVFSSTEVACPRCEGKELEKLLSVFAVGGAGPRQAPGNLPPACAQCGDPRGPGACALD